MAADRGAAVNDPDAFYSGIAAGRHLASADQQTLFFLRSERLLNKGSCLPGVLLNNSAFVACATVPDEPERGSAHTSTQLPSGSHGELRTAIAVKLGPHSMYSLTT